MGNYWRFEDNPFWHHEWKGFDLEGFVRSIGRLIAGNVIAQVGLVVLFALTKFNTLWLGLDLFIVTMVFHLIARVRIERLIPQRSFVEDWQRGALDFVRLLPVSGHELVVARKLPAWFIKVFVAGLWAPLYASSFAFLGFPPTSTIPFSLTFGVLGWSETFIAVLLFFAPLPVSFSLPALFATALALPSASITRVDEVPMKRHLPFLTAILALVFIAIQLEAAREGKSAFEFLSPHPFYGTLLTPAWAALWLMMAAGWVRVDRIARWLETPKGLRRFYFVPALFVSLFFAQGFLWGWLQQVERWMPGDCFAASASFTFALGGVLHWLWLNWLWAEKAPAEKPPSWWLPETIAWRSVTVAVPILGCWLSSLSLSQVDFGFFSVWLFLSALDLFSIALTKSIAFRAMVERRWGGVEFLSSLALVPLLGFVLGLPLLVAFSPSAALLVLGWQPLTATFSPIRLWSGISLAVPKVSLLAAVTAPMVRVLLLALFWRLVGSPELRLGFRFKSGLLARAVGFVNLVGEFVFIIPAAEKLLLARVQNPVFKHMVSVTRWRYSWLPYLAAFVLGLLRPAITSVSSVVIALALVPALWFTTYTTVHSYLRKLHQTGELWQWLITPLPSKMIVNGWRYGGWWWQARWLALLMWMFVGVLVGSGANHMLKLWLFLTPVLVIISALGTLVVAVMVMGAVTVAIYDALREPQQAFTQKGKEWSTRKAQNFAILMTTAVAISIASCGLLWFVAPIVGLAITGSSIDPAIRALERIRKAPMERMLHG